MASAITQLIHERGRTRANVAKALRRPPSWIYRITSGKHEIKAIDLQALADELDVPITALYPPDLRQLAERAGVHVDLQPIPVIDQEASASLQGGVTVDHMYIRGTGSGKAPHNLIGVRVHGDCLAPWIIDGDVVVVDTTRTPESGNPVVATVDGALHVKRLRIRPSGRWTLVWLCTQRPVNGGLPARSIPRTPRRPARRALGLPPGGGATDVQVRGSDQRGVLVGVLELWPDLRERELDMRLGLADGLEVAPGGAAAIVEDRDPAADERVEVALGPVVPAPLDRQDVRRRHAIGGQTLTISPSRSQPCQPQPPFSARTWSDGEAVSVPSSGEPVHVQQGGAFASWRSGQSHAWSQ